jgi:nicotinamidase-related amidase
MVDQAAWRSMLRTWYLPVPDFDVAPAETVLLVVDMQYSDAHPDYGLGRLFRTVDPERSSYYFSRLNELVVPNIRRLLKHFRRLGVRVIYLTLGPVLEDGSDLSPNFRRRYRSEEDGLGFRVTFPLGTFEHSILSDLKPEQQELVINKTANGAFNSSDIDRVLRNLGTKTLVVVGVGTDVCVETTARDAVDRGYNCVVVDDACATLDQASHDASLLAFAKWFGRVLDTSEVIRILSDPVSTDDTSA